MYECLIEEIGLYRRNHYPKAVQHTKEVSL